LRCRVTAASTAPVETSYVAIAMPRVGNLPKLKAVVSGGAVVCVLHAWTSHVDDVATDLLPARSGAGRGLDPVHGSEAFAAGDEQHSGQ
jgi:hypothetical protein